MNRLDALSRRTVLGALGGLLAVSRGVAAPDPGSTRWDWKPPVWPDVEVLDQHGRKLRFSRDLLAGRTVAVSFVFTSCSSICSPISAGLGSVQRHLQARLGRDIHLVSVTIDPLTDTPQVLAQYGARFGAGAGWTFVTGARPAIERILAAFGMPAGGDLSDHSPYLYIGNEAARAWTRVHGLSDPKLVAATLERAAGLPRKEAAGRAT